MKSTRNLRLRLRLMEGALLLLLAVGTTAAVSTHQLLLDAVNRPTGDVSLTSPHVVGTLDAARLPANVPLLTAQGNLLLGGGGGSLIASGVFFGTLYTAQSQQIADSEGNVFAPGNLYANGNTSLDNEAITTDGQGSLSLGGNLFVGGNLIVDNSGELVAGGNLLADSNGNVYAGGIQIANGNGELISGNGTCLIADVQGFVHVGTQTYHAGSAAPTGYLLIKDATNTVYRIPASVAP